VGKIKARLYEVLQEVAIERGWQISAVTIEPEHVHLLVEYDPDHSIAQVAKAFKGRSSRVLRKEFPELLKMPSLWTHGYFHETTGKISTAAIRDYINSPHYDGK
jgi:putative transposase